MNTITNEPKDCMSKTAVLLERLDELLGVYEPLTGDEVRRLPRLGKRRETIVTEIEDVCRESRLESAGSASIDDMVFSQQEAKALREQLEMLDLVRARLDAKRLLVEADLARHAYFFYDLARNASRFDKALRERMEPVIALFQTRKTRPRRQSEAVERP